MNELITESEMMEKMKVSRSILYQLRKEGMPFVRIGRMVRYNPETVETWLATYGQEDVLNAGKNEKEINNVQE